MAPERSQGKPMQKISDAIVLFGGQCGERRVSVASAQTLVAHLNEPLCLFWAPSGAVFSVDPEMLLAHQRAFEIDLECEGEPAHPDLAAALDALGEHANSVLVALHGGSGEDGTVQRMMEDRKIPFTGSGAAASALAFDKILARNRVSEEGIRVSPAHPVSGLDLEAASGRLKAMMARPGGAVLKPVADGSSGGLHMVVDDATLHAALEELAAAPHTPFMVEAFVTGTELTVGVAEKDGILVPLPCSEVRLEAGRSFDYAGKYLGEGTLEITPAEVSEATAHAAQEVALRAHRLMGCRGYSRTDVIVDEKGPVFLELNTLPGLTAASFIPQQLEAAGWELDAFLREQLAIAKEACLPPKRKPNSLSAAAATWA
jgi:D-alanine-D-alanine ligase